MPDPLNCCIAVCDGDAEVSVTDDGALTFGPVEDGENGEYYRVGNYEQYAGPYEITPSREEQTVEAANRVFADDLIIRPIPENYGLIEWNGYSLRVS